MVGRLFLFFLVLCLTYSGVAFSNASLIDSKIYSAGNGEYFFHVKFPDNRAPYVRFDLNGAKVKTRSTITKGASKFYKYTLTKVGRASEVIKVNNIKLYLGEKVLRLGNLRLQEKRRSLPSRSFSYSDILVEMDSNDFYFNKGITLKYSLLSLAIPINYRILEFPQYDGFIKRFKDIGNRSKKVYFEGRYVYKTPLYFIEIFPMFGSNQNITEMKVVLNEQSKSQKRIITSVPINIEAKEPYPNMDKVKEVPLLEKHSLLVLNKPNKTSESIPFEFQVKVAGPGLLEKLSPPSLGALDIHVRDITISSQKYNPGKAEKIFSYTVTIDEEGEYKSDVIFHYFDLAKKKFSMVSRPITFNVAPLKVKTVEEMPENPMFIQKSSFNSSLMKTVLFLFLFILLVFNFFRIKVVNIFSSFVEATLIYRRFIRGILDYEFLYKIINPLGSDDLDLSSLVQSQKCSEKVKSSLIKLVNDLRLNNYFDKRSVTSIDFYYLFLFLLENRANREVIQNERL